MSASSQAIFLSYASQDADAARRVCDALRAAGLEVWFDQSELRGGDAWDASIRKQIKECSLFVPIISNNTQAREEGYFRLEWKLAVDRSHLMADDKAFFFPVVLNDVAEPKARVPDKFRERQWSRLNDDTATTMFAERIAKLIAGSALSNKSASKSSPVLAIAQTVTPTQNDAIPSIAAPSIAVLAFANRSASTDDEYFSDGLADELLNVLAKIKGLRVAARTSSFQFKGKSEDISEIGRRLNVAHVLEGSVRKSGNRARISVQLVKVADGYHLWSETYDRTLDDIFAVQDDIAQSVVQELRSALLGNAQGIGPHRQDSLATGSTAATLGRTQNSEAHRLRMQGRSLFQRPSHPDRKAAIPYFERAVEIDPQYAGAWADLSFALYWQSASGGDGREDSFEHNYLEGFHAAKIAAERATSLEPNLPEALLARAAMVRILDWNQTEALQLMRKAAELAPNDAQILHGAAVVIGDSGHYDEALSLARRAIELDPISRGSYAEAGALEAATGNFTAAESLYRIACDMAASNMFHPRFGLWLCLLAQQRLAECEAMLPLWSVDVHRLLPEAILAWQQRDFAKSDAKLAEMIAMAAVLACYQIAQVYAFRGKADPTFDWLEKCIEVRDPAVFGVKTDPLFKPFHDDPRWPAIMQKLGFAGQPNMPLKTLSEAPSEAQ